MGGEAGVWSGRESRGLTGHERALLQDKEGAEGKERAPVLDSDPLDTLDLITTQAHLFGADPSAAQVLPLEGVSCA